MISLQELRFGLEHCAAALALLDGERMRRVAEFYTADSEEVEPPHQCAGHSLGHIMSPQHATLCPCLLAALTGVWGRAVDGSRGCA